MNCAKRIFFTLFNRLRNEKDTLFVSRNSLGTKLATPLAPPTAASTKRRHTPIAGSAMATEAASKRVALLSHSGVLALFSHKSGKHWLTLRDALQEAEVEGADLATHVTSVDALFTFLSEEAALNLPRMVVAIFFKLLCEAPGPREKVQQNAPLVRVAPPLPATRSGGHVDAGGDAGDAAAGGGGRAPPGPPLASLRVKAALSGQDADLHITVRVGRTAAVRAVARQVMERLHLGLTSAIKLLHAGRELAATAAVDWSTFSFVHAVVLADSRPLTISNAPSHPLVATKVVLSSRRIGALAGANAEGGLTLHVKDAGLPLGNGAFGAVYEGSVDDGVRTRKVAVKKFFMLTHPIMYGLASALDVQTWVERDLLPEVNILASLAHKNVIRLRCVGLDAVSHAVVPAYVAMDLCSGGTLQSWITDGNITDRLMVEFTCDLIDAMMYLHQDKKVVHRDIKPDNIFVHDDERQQRPYLVLGDIGLAKALNRSASFVSAAGAVAYRAPEACTDAAKCSQASDVYSVSLVAVELVTGRCVYSQSNGDLAVGARLAADATTKLGSALEFCGDAWLSSRAAELLLQACTIQDPTARPSFQAIVSMCPRHEKTLQQVQQAKEAQRVQQLRDFQAKEAQREQQLRDFQAKEAQREQQLRDFQAKEAQREQQLRDFQAKEAQHEQQLRDMQAALEAANKGQTELRPERAPPQQGKAHTVREANKEAERMQEVQQDQVLEVETKEAEGHAEEDGIARPQTTTTILATRASLLALPIHCVSSFQSLVVCRLSFVVASVSMGWCIDYVCNG